MKTVKPKNKKIFKENLDNGTYVLISPSKTKGIFLAYENRDLEGKHNTVTKYGNPDNPKRNLVQLDLTEIFEEKVLKEIAGEK